MSGETSIYHGPGQEGNRSVHPGVSIIVHGRACHSSEVFCLEQGIGRKSRGDLF